MNAAECFDAATARVKQLFRAEGWPRTLHGRREMIARVAKAMHEKGVEQVCLVTARTIAHEVLKHAINQ